MPGRNSPNKGLLDTELQDLSSKQAGSNGTGKRSPHFETSLLRWWGWELTMVAISASASVALIVVLAVESGRPQRRWVPLTLNAAVAILTTIAGSSLAALVGSCLSQSLWNGFAQRREEAVSAVATPLRDVQILNDASRGPMGSLTLLLKHGLLNIASLGASATLLNLAFATFTQQLVTTETQLREAGSAMPFARSQTYRANSASLQEGVASAKVDYATLSSIIGAALQGNKAAPLTPSCPSGNCTYSVYIPTLAAHGECTDVSDKLDNTGTCQWNTPPCNESNSEDCHALGEPCIYRLPTGPALKWQPGASGNGLYILWNVTSTLETASNLD